jgi:cation diffusion facilitator CzcD-associated flavoprotein CzcO
LAYVKGVAEKYELYKNIKLSHMVNGATWNEDDGTWRMKVKNLETGEEFNDWCHFLVNGSGILKFVLHIPA